MLSSFVEMLKYSHVIICSNLSIIFLDIDFFTADFTWNVPTLSWSLHVSGVYAANNAPTFINDMNGFALREDTPVGEWTVLESVNMLGVYILNTYR